MNRADYPEHIQREMEAFDRRIDEVIIGGFASSLQVYKENVGCLQPAFDQRLRAALREPNEVTGRFVIRERHDHDCEQHTCFRDDHGTAESNCPGCAPSAVDPRPYVVDTLRTVASWLPEDADLIHGAIRNVERMSRDDIHCGMCQEIECDDDCPLIGWRTSP